MSRAPVVARACAACRVALLLASAGCAQEGDSWRHTGPVGLSPTPRVLTPPHPLVPGGVRSELCIALPDGYEPARDRASGARAADGTLVHVRVVFLTRSGERHAYPGPDYELRGNGLTDRLCFEAGDSEPGPPFAAVELTATAPLVAKDVEWRVARMGSL